MKGLPLAKRVRWWTVQDVADLLGVSTKTVKNMDADGRLKCHHKVNDRGDRRYDPGVVMAYQATREAQP